MLGLLYRLHRMEIQITLESESGTSNMDYPRIESKKE